MKAAIITIGDEILIGQIIDTNSGYIAKALDKIGVEIVEIISISDSKQHILNTLTNFQNKVDIVLITGGLGPTKDDITKHTLCNYFQDNLVINQTVLEHVTRLIEAYYNRPISDINRNQAMVPSQCQVLFNAVGTAPGMWLLKEKTVFVSLPGVPFEMKHLIDNQVIPKIIKEYNRPYIIHKTILTYGMGESLLAETIADWENNLPHFIKLAYLPNPGRVRLRLTAKGTDKLLLENTLQNLTDKLTAILGSIIIGFDDNESIEAMIGKILLSQKRTLSTAESCTGGKIAQEITSVAGASQYFKGSIVAYDTQIKINLLQLDAKMITENGVVSKKVAQEMALSIQKIMKTDYAIATTGNAGPTSNDDKSSVGTVFIALATPNEVFVAEFNFGQPREKVINRTVNKAFEILLKEISKNVS